MSIALTRTHATYTTDETLAPDCPFPSIRQIMLSGIAFDAPKFAVKAQVEACHPHAKGTEKFGTHYSWYKSQVAKAGTKERAAVLKLWDAAFHSDAAERGVEAEVA